MIYHCGYIYIYTYLFIWRHNVRLKHVNHGYSINVPVLLKCYGNMTVDTIING
jgi:hypothetical protein